MPATFKLKPGSRVDYRGKTCVILKTVTTDTVEVRIEDGNITRTVSAFELFPPDSKTARHDPLPALDHHSEYQLAEASKRYALIELILKSLAGRGELVRKQATAAGVSVKTIYRWIKKYRDYGRVSALAPGRKGRKMPSRLDPRVEKIIKSVVDNAYLTEQKPKISAIIEKIRGLCKKRGLPLPHGNTIRNRIKKIHPRIAMERREGRKAARDKFAAAAGSFPHATAPLSVVQIDHTELNVQIVDDVNRLPIGRAWITVGIDVHTRMITGFHVSLDAPSALSVGACIANSCLEKDALLEEYKIKGTWPVWGLMAAIHADNGKDFRSTSIAKSCMEHGISVEWRPCGSPEFGGHIERFMGVLATELRNIPGTTFANIKERGAYDSEGRATLTLRETEEYILEWIVNIYHNRFHKGIDMTPLRKWEAGILGTENSFGAGLPPKIANASDFRISFLPSAERTIQRGGVQWDNMRYYDGCIDHLINKCEGQRNQNFIFRRDPRDVSKIYFYNAERKAYTEIPWTRSDPYISVWELRAAKEKLREENISNPTEDQIFEALDRQAKRIKEASVKTKKARRAQQKEREWRRTATNPIPVSDMTVSTPPSDSHEREDKPIQLPDDVDETSLGEWL